MRYGAVLVLEHLNAQGDVLLALKHQVVDGVLQLFDILGAIAVYEVFEVHVPLLRVALLVHPFERLGEYVIRPDTHITGFQDERQSVIVLAYGAGHLPFTESVEDIIDEEAQCNDSQAGGCFHHP